MKNKTAIIIAAVLILAIAAVLGAQHFSRNERTYELNLPVAENISQIIISRDSDSVTITDAAEIKDIRNVVKRHTTEESIQDIPTSVDNLIRVDMYGTDEKIYTVFAYEKNDKLYFEQPYNGIYRISPDEFNSIEKYLRSAPSEKTNSIPFDNLAPGAEVTYPSTVSAFTNDAWLDYSVTYSSTTLKLVIGLRSEDGTEYTAEVTGDNNSGKITGFPSGNYTVFVRSNEESLNVTGAMNFVVGAKVPEDITYFGKG